MTKSGTPSGAGPGLARVRVGLEAVGAPLGLRIGCCWIAFGLAAVPPLRWRWLVRWPRPPLPPGPPGPTPPVEVVPVLPPPPLVPVVPVVPVLGGTVPVDPPDDQPL